MYVNINSKTCKNTKTIVTDGALCTLLALEPRIIYIRFLSKLAVLLRRIKNQNIGAEIKSQSLKLLATYGRKNEVFTEVAFLKATSIIGRSGNHVTAGLLELAGVVSLLTDASYFAIN